MSINPIGFHPGARVTDPETSHEALDGRDHSDTQSQILQDVKANGPGTEEMILNRMGVPRTNASSQISALVESGHLVNLIDLRTQKKIKLRNTSGARALVRGLPAHQNHAALIERLLVQMDNESEAQTARQKPSLSTAGADKAIERRRGERRRADRRKRVARLG
jgi:DNA-binding MarR family transcriptional regulator